MQKLIRWPLLLATFLTVLFSSQNLFAQNRISAFYALNMSLVRGESTVIYWNASGASYARVFGFGQELNPLERRLDGGMPVKPEKDTSYELKLYNERNEEIESQLFTIIVTDQEPAVEVKRFEVSSAAVQAGAPVELRYEVRGFKELSIIDQATGLEYKHLNFCCSLTLWPQKSTVYALRIKDRKDRITQYLQSVDVLPTPQIAPSIINFRASSTSVSPGTPVLLNWLVSGNIGYIRIIERSTGQVFSGLAAQSELYVYPQQSGYYTLEAASPSGQIATADLYLDINQSVFASIDFFTASRYEINAGEAVFLSWKTRNALDAALVTNGDYQNANFDIAFPEGSVVLYPSQTTVYNLKVLSPNGQTVDRTLEVFVRNANPRVTACSASASASSVSTGHGSSSAAASASCSRGTVSSSASATGGLARAEAWLRW